MIFFFLGHVPFLKNFLVWFFETHPLSSTASDIFPISGAIQRPTSPFFLILICYRDDGRPVGQRCFDIPTSSPGISTVTCLSATSLLRISIFLFFFFSSLNQFSVFHCYSLLIFSDLILKITFFLMILFQRNLFCVLILYFLFNLLLFTHTRSPISRTLFVSFIFLRTFKKIFIHLWFLRHLFPLYSHFPFLFFFLIHFLFPTLKSFSTH